MYADAASFLIGAACVFLIQGAYSALRDNGGTPAPRRPLRQELAAGVPWLFRHRLLRLFTLVGGFYNMITIGQLAVLVLYAKQTLHTSDAGYGLLLSTVAVGSVGAGFVATRIATRTGAIGAAFGAMCVGELAYGAFGVAHTYWVVAVALAMTGATSMIWNVQTVSLRQSLVPKALQGRVNGAHRLVLFGLQPLGALLGGWVAARWGLRAPYLWGAPIALAVTVPGWVAAHRAYAAYREPVPTPTKG
jgi:MFS family permease